MKTKPVNKLPAKTKTPKVYIGPAISTVSKLDGIRSWSLEAGPTCAGSIDPKTGELVPACAGCYAMQNNYIRFESVKAPRQHNLKDYRRASWVADMVKLLDSDRYFRWFDSGDLHSVELAEKILEVMILTPWTKHWLPTRMHKFPKYAQVLAKMQLLPNVSVRFSSDSVTGEFKAGLHGSTIISDASEAPAGVTPCTAPNTGGKCAGCRACWDKSVPVIGYIGHTKKMEKVIRIQKAK